VSGVPRLAAEAYSLTNPSPTLSFFLRNHAMTLLHKSTLKLTPF
jgi:hypothetical protein